MLANGFEEIEAFTTIDILRRAGIDTLSVSVSTERTVHGAHDVAVEADALISEIDTRTLPLGIVLPGGLPGATNLHESAALLALLRKQMEARQLVAAICAAPAEVLGVENMLSGRNVTCYPSFEEKLLGATHMDNWVVVDDNLITAQGPAAAFDFALAIVEKLKGESVSQEVADGLLWQ